MADQITVMYDINMAGYRVNTYTNFQANPEGSSFILTKCVLVFHEMTQEETSLHTSFRVYCRIIKLYVVIHADD